MIRIVCLSLLLGNVPTFAQQTNHSSISREPISADRMNIYHDFLNHYENGSKGTVNLAQTTVSFEPDESDRTGCLKQFKRRILSNHQVHTFPADSFQRLSILLVDEEKHKILDPGEAIRNGQTLDDAVESAFAAGLFTFSEIVFDASHTHAAFTYSFFCGSLCGHGGTVVYELKNRKWTKAKNQCGNWIS